VAALASWGCGAEPARDPGAVPVPGLHCFEAATETFEGTVRLSIAGDGRVTGQSAATIHDESEGYFTSYRQELAGTMSGERLDLEVTTWIEGDRQVAREIWRQVSGRLDDGRNTFEIVDCEGVADRFEAAPVAP
jgi:hypothetical protein